VGEKDFVSRAPAEVAGGVAQGNILGRVEDTVHQRGEKFGDTLVAVRVDDAVH